MVYYSVQNPKSNPCCFSHLQTPAAPFHFNFQLPQFFLAGQSLVRIEQRQKRELSLRPLGHVPPGNYCLQTHLFVEGSRTLGDLQFTGFPVDLRSSSWRFVFGLLVDFGYELGLFTLPSTLTHCSNLKLNFSPSGQ